MYPLISAAARVPIHTTYTYSIVGYAFERLLVSRGWKVLPKAVLTPLILMAQYSTVVTAALYSLSYLKLSPAGHLAFFTFTVITPLLMVANRTVPLKGRTLNNPGTLYHVTDLLLLAARVVNLAGAIVYFIKPPMDPFIGLLTAYLAFDCLEHLQFTFKQLTHPAIPPLEPLPPH